MRFGSKNYGRWRVPELSIRLCHPGSAMSSLLYQDKLQFSFKCSTALIQGSDIIQLENTLKYKEMQICLLELRCVHTGIFVCGGIAVRTLQQVPSYITRLFHTFFFFCLRQEMHGWLQP